ncbi:type VI secretion system-associated lipoprotein [Bordetella genomosp. 10]|uniref:Type VI secretion system-associated lipoprotein n=1 Tax=Bordetella genomosp. 10 TaxID=1416804 RepID=A0A261S018_9BORD|nr:type VI secretion system lipoprotein TssJ [Bordetella genomosp. 10]OZI30696.1 type VI secretion system-associated lipoprotein [Bordetella genomosp. 10]
MLRRLLFSRPAAWACIALGMPILAGCAAAGAIGAVASATGSLLEATGLKKPDDAPTDVKFSIQAGQNLNISNGQAMAVVTKIYYLKNSDSFKQAPMSSLIDEKQEKERLGDSVIAKREVTLMPGQVYQNTEKVPKEATAIGVAALFFAPAPYRWKYVFDIKDAKDSGIVLGAHACALTVATGKVSPPLGSPPFDASRLGSLQCPA